jgi:integrase
MAQKFTDLFLKGLKAKDKEYTARESGGFGVRVMPSGRKVLFYLYRVDGQRRFLNLGDYPATDLKEARKKFEAAQAQVKLLKNGLPGGVDPVEVKTTKSVEREERRKAPTVSDLCTEYLERHAKRKKRSWQKDEEILNRDVLPAWGKRKAKDIRKSDIVELMERIVMRGAPIMANYCFAILRKMYNWAIEQDILETTPFIGVKLPSVKNARDRVLSEAEIKTFWASLNRTDLNMSYGVKQALRLVLVTAQRPGEILGMHSSEIDGNWWTIPAERTKNGKTHRVYLTETALDLIGDLKIKDKKTGKDVFRGYIYPSPVKKDKDGNELEIKKPIGDTSLSVAVARNLAHPLTDKKGNPLLDEEGKAVTENRFGIDHFTPHDLRRTAATLMAKGGEMDEVIDAVLNHSKQGVIKVYNQYRYDNEKQKAMEALAEKLQVITTPPLKGIFKLVNGKKVRRIYNSEGVEIGAEPPT